jgi:hypothetical protein
VIDRQLIDAVAVCLLNLTKFGASHVGYQIFIERGLAGKEGNDRSFIWLNS